METTSSGNVGRSNLPRESASQLAARETDPTPVVTRSSEVSRVEPTSSMVLRSRTLGGRRSAAIPDVEMRPEIEFRQEPEMDNPAEIQVSMSAICEGGSDTTRQDIPEIAGEYVAADRPETSAAFPTSPKNNPNSTNITEISTSHTCLQSCQGCCRRWSILTV